MQENKVLQTHCSFVISLKYTPNEKTPWKQKSWEMEQLTTRRVIGFGLLGFFFPPLKANHQQAIIILFGK